MECNFWFLILHFRIDVHTGKVVHTEERDLDKIVRDDPREKFRLKKIFLHISFTTSEDSKEIQ